MLPVFWEGKASSGPDTTAASFCCTLTTLQIQNEVAWLLEGQTGIFDMSFLTDVMKRKKGQDFFPYSILFTHGIYGLIWG